jgi:hypothetical protein
MEINQSYLSQPQETEINKQILYLRIHHIDIIRDLAARMKKLGAILNDKNTQDILNGWVTEIWGEFGFDNSAEMVRITMEVFNQIMSCSPDILIVPVADFRDELCRRACQQRNFDKKACEMGGINVPEWLVKEADEKIAKRSGLEIDQPYSPDELLQIIDKTKWAVNLTLVDILIHHPSEVFKPLLMEIKERIIMAYRTYKEWLKRKLSALKKNK